MANNQKAIQKALDVANAVKNANISAAQPAVSALQETATPLKQRYDDLIASIKSNQQVAENRQTVTTNNELAKRGILSSSGVGQQEMTSALNPITSDYTGRIKDASNQQNLDLANLATQIAQLKSGAAQTGLNQGFGIYNQIQQLDASQKASAANTSLDYQKYLADLPYKQSQTDLNNARIASLQKNLGGGGAIDFTSLWNDAMGSKV